MATTDNNNNNDNNPYEDARKDDLVNEIVAGKMTGKEFLMRLLFTKSNELDTGQIMFLLATFYFFLSFGLAGIGTWTVSVAAWSIFGSVFLTLSINGTSTNVARLIANSKSIGEVSQGISQAAMGGGEPNMYKDNEQGSNPNREEVDPSVFNSGK